MPKKTGDFRLSEKARRARRQPISYLMAQAVTNPDLISLAAGLVDYDTLPAAEVGRIVGELFSNERSARVALQYGTTPGLAELREALLEHLVALDGVKPGDLAASPDDVVVATGSQQLLLILTDILVDPGDIVITAWPSYFVYTSTLEAAGARVRAVEIDENGIIPEALDATLGALAAAGELPRVRIVYVVSYHQNPTGITLSSDRRPAVLDVVRKYSRDHRILLIEDAAYRELTYEGTAPLSIKRYDRGNEHVALVQSFSKAFSPGFKTGYALLPRDLVEPVVLQKGNHDFGSSNLTQHVLLAALRGRVYARHLETLRRHYAAKRDAILAAMDEHLGDFAPGQCRWTRPSGGLYTWLTLPEGTDTGPDGALMARALAEGVLYVPGEYCYGPDPGRTAPRNAMRLTFGVGSVERIGEGIARLARAIRA